VGPDPDPLVEEVLRARRDRRVLVVAIAIGIVTSVVLGLGAALGGLGGAEPRNHAALAYFVIPLVASLVIGNGLYWLRRRRRIR
jgi:hypothetical protein